MKKTYLQPETLLTEIMTQQLMQSASVSGPELKDGEADPDGEVLSRGSRSIWDDEE